MTPAKRISIDTWERIKQSWDYNVRLGEETLTDLLILDLARYTPEGVRLFQTPKVQEARNGTDMEIIINIGGRSIALSIQAKKLYRSGRYDHLYARVSGTNTHQIDILESYSRHTGAIPVYLLYNSSVDVAWEKEGQLCRRLALQHGHRFCSTISNIQHLGCTIAPSWRIRQAIESRGCRTFEWIHSHSSVFPWHCLFDCPHAWWFELLNRDRDILEGERHEIEPDQNQRRYEWLEFRTSENLNFDWLWDHDAVILTESDLKKFYDVREVSRTNLIYKVPEGDEWEGIHKTVDLIPRHIMLIKPSDTGII